MVRSAIFGLLALCGCARQTASPLTAGEFAAARWEDVVKRAAGSTVYFGMWAGDEARNRYYQSDVTERLQRQYQITLRIVPASDTAQIVNKLLNERRAGRAAGSIDMLWINGENFRTAKEAGVLWGPFAERIPNVRFYDPLSLRRDFGTPIEGFEAPWQRSEYVFAYDSARVPAPPKSFAALRDWVKAHPGRFTYIAPPDFTGSAFIRHVLMLQGDAAGFRTFDEAFYQKAAAGAIAYLNDLKPFLWRRGETYPPSLSELTRMFANSEVDFTMSYGPSYASMKIARGELPAATRTFVMDSGALGNYSYLAIPFNAANAAGALVAINHLLSFDHMLEQSTRLGDSLPHQLDPLTPQQRAAAEAIPRGPATLSEAELAAHFMAEPDAQYLTRFEQDWLLKVLRK